MLPFGNQQAGVNGDSAERVRTLRHICIVCPGRILAGRTENPLARLLLLSGLRFVLLKLRLRPLSVLFGDDDQ